MSSILMSPQMTATSEKKDLKGSRSLARRRQPKDSFSESQAAIRGGMCKGEEAFNAPTSGANSESTESSTKDNDQTKFEAISIETLRKRMELDDWLCGGCTLKEDRCTRLIFEQRQTKISSQLKQLSNTLQSSKTVERDLEALVILVHCHQHDHGYAKQDRLDRWAKVLPKGSLSPTFILENQIKKALGRIEQRCIGLNQKGKPCGQRVGGQRIQNCSKTVLEILQPDVHEDSELLEGFLKVLEANMYCRFHVDRQGYKRVGKWKSSIIEVLEKFKDEAVETSLPDSHPVKEEVDIITTTTEIAKTTVRQPPTPRNTRSLSPEFYHRPSRFWHEALDTTPFQRLSRLEAIPTPKQCYNLVKQTATKALPKPHTTSGYIYIYSVPGNNGLVKLGYTKALAKRHEEWRFDCNRETNPLYPPSDDELILVQNAPRVEALCHAELDYCRVRVDCGACLKEHVEWFKIELGECIRVVEKWTRWMGGRPYEHGGAGGTMSLKEEERQRMEDMDGFMDSIAMLV